MPPAALPPITIRLDQVKEACTRAGFTTHASIAAALGVTESTVSRVLGGHVEPSSRFVFELARVLDVTPDSLFAQTQT